MEQLTFETLVMPADFYEAIVSFSVKVIGISILIMLGCSLIFRHIKINMSLMWYVYIPKIIVSIMAVILVFCFDYETRELHKPMFDNMLMSTFLVGVLAIIEILSTIASMIKDICDKFNRD